MIVTIGTFEHYCTSEQDCGEEISRPGASVKLVRKWAWRDAKGKILKLFVTEAEAHSEAERLGYEVSA